MRLKTVGLVALTLLAAASVFGSDPSGPAGSFIKVGASVNLLGDVDTAGKANGNCLVYNSSTGQWAPGTCGGAGASTLNVAVGGTQISSPTATINFSSNTFTGNQSPAGTANITLNPSSATLQGNTFNAANKLVQLDGSGFVPNANIDPSSVTKLGPSIDLSGETTGNYVASIVAGTAISVGAAGHGSNPSIHVVPSLLVGDQTWSNGGFSPVTWTWDVTGTDPKLIFSDDSIETLSPFTAASLISADLFTGDLNTNTLTTGAGTINGKSIAFFSDTLTPGTTIAYASGTITALNVTTINGSSYPPGGSGGGFWIGTATSSLNMNNFAVYGATEIVTSSFSVTGATETHNGFTYINPSTTTAPTGQNLLAWTVSGGKLLGNFYPVITDGMQRSSTDTKTGALVMQSSFTLPTFTQVSDVDATGEIAVKTNAYTSAGSSSTVVFFADGKKYYVVATTAPPADNQIAKWDAALNQWNVEADAGGAGSPGGSDQQLQFNDASAFNGISVATYSKTSNLLTFSSGVTHINIATETFTDVNVVFAGTSKVSLGGTFGTSGQVFTSNGSSSAPSWTTVSGGGGGSSSLAVTTGSVNGFSSVTSSPTAVLDFSSDTFKVALQGGSTAFVTLDPSSVTLLGASIEDSEVSDSITIGSGGSVNDAALSANVTKLGATITLDEVGGGAAGANAYDFGGATSLEIPNGSGPTVDAIGETALRTDVTTFNYPAVIYSTGADSTSQMYVVAVASAEFFNAANNDVILYDSSTKQFKTAAVSGDNLGNGIATTDVDFTTHTAKNLDHIEWADSGNGWKTYASSISYVTADFSFTTSSPTVFTMQLAANSTYFFEGRLVVASPSSSPSGFRITANGPSGPASFRLICSGGTSAITTGNFGMSTTTLGTYTGTTLAASNSQTWLIPFTAYLITGTSSGSFTVQLGPQGNGSYTVRQTASYMIGYKAP